MSAAQPKTTSLLRRLNGRKVSTVAVDDNGSLVRVHFENGAVLSVSGAGLTVDVTLEPVTKQDGLPRPTERQREYLAFIAKYIQRFGVAPAEADIQRHFLVEAPSVNQMMQTLERRGFITRQPGVARSIRLCVDITAA